MSVFPASIFAAAFLLSVLASPALAQNAPLALPPSTDQPIIPKIEPPGLATEPPPELVAAPEPVTPATAATAESTTPAPEATTTAVPTIAAPAPAAATPPPLPVVTPATTPAGTTAPAQLAIAPIKNTQPAAAAITLPEGGLGATLWKGTSRIFVEQFFPLLNFPSTYASLNNLAYRFLLTTATEPEGTGRKDAPSLTAMRVDKLIMLGKGAEAWKLSTSSTEPTTETALRATAEAALVTPAARDVCAKLPNLIQKSYAVEWQKLLVVCQLQNNDLKAAQVSLDLLHAQDVHDDTFYTMAEKNLILGTKQLPRQMTPLKPIVLSLLRMTDLPARGEIYAHPDAVLIPELLKTKLNDELFRLALAERAAFHGLISATDLATTYKERPFTTDEIANALISGEHGPVLRALLFQAATQEQAPKRRIDLMVKFMQSLDNATTGGNVLPAMGLALGDIPAAATYNLDSASVARIYVLAGKSSQALAWLELARGASRGMPQVALDLQALWPLVALGGMETDSQFNSDLDKWMAATLRPGDPQDSDVRASKNLVAAIMMLCDETGLTVTEDEWAKVADTATPERSLSTPALIKDRLRAAIIGNRKGEVVMLSLLATTGTAKEDPSLGDNLAVIHALRAVGLNADAGSLAKDVGMRILTAANK